SLNGLGFGHGLADELLHRRAVRKRNLAGEQEVEGTAEAVEVRANIGGMHVARLLRRYEVRRSHDGVRARQQAARSIQGAVSILQAGEPEIADLGGSEGITTAAKNENVGGLDIPVHHSLMMGELQPRRDLP